MTLAQHGTHDQSDHNLDMYLGGMSGGGGVERKHMSKGIEASVCGRRVLLLAGHLPVMSGIWISQEAERFARAHGSTCLVRIESSSVQLELFRPGAQRPSISTHASIAEALRAMAGMVEHWLIVPRAQASVEIGEHVSRVVVLTGHEDITVVHAFSLLKQSVECLKERAANATRPSIEVIVVGATDEAYERVATTLTAAATNALSVDVQVSKGSQRIAPMDAAFRGTFESPSLSLHQFESLLQTAEAAAVREAKPAVALHAASASASASASAGRFAPRSQRTPPRSEPVVRARSVGALDATPLPFPAVAPVATTPSLAQPAAAQPPAPPSHPTAPLVGLLPEPAALHPARVIAGELPTTLTPHFAGLSRFPFRAPRAPAIEIACDGDGTIHVIGAVRDLEQLMEVRSWLREHSEMLRAAHNAWSSNDDVIIDVVHASLERAKPLDGVRVWALVLVEVHGYRGYLAHRAS